MNLTTSKLLAAMGLALAVIFALVPRSTAAGAGQASAASAPPKPGVQMHWFHSHASGRSPQNLGTNFGSTVVVGVESMDDLASLRRSFGFEDVQTVPALHAAMHEALDEQRGTLAIPRRFDATMKELWLMQPRFLQRGGHRPFRLLEHPRFRAAYDFFARRAESANAPQEAAKWWERFQDASPDERERMLVSDESGPKKRRRRRKKKPAGAGDAGEGAPE